jgi:hypothetical protein
MFHFIEQIKICKGEFVLYYVVRDKKVDGNLPLEWIINNLHEVSDVVAHAEESDSDDDFITTMDIYKAIGKNSLFYKIDSQ